MVNVVARGGLPVTEAASGLAIPDNGLGIAVTIVAKGGVAVVFKPPRVTVPPTLQLTSIAPTTMPANVTTAFKAIGVDFLPTSRIEVGGTLHTTTFINSTELWASIKKMKGTLPVKIKTGSAYSNAINLTVT